jgi:hypothetical protein
MVTTLRAKTWRRRSGIRKNSNCLRVKSEVVRLRLRTQTEPMPLAILAFSACRFGPCMMRA